MINYYFGQPIYTSNFDSNLIELSYSTHKQWASNTTTSYLKDNKITEKSSKILFCSDFENSK